ncbi:MAG: SPOR domain-containing protein [Azoarcus sp.]|nr:SPOR domain-containing protein [Azoarcus sp.]
MNVENNVDTQHTLKPENTLHYVKNVNVLASKSGQNLFLQLGLFTSRENAESLRDRAVIQVAELLGQIELNAEGGYFRLFTGPYPSLDAAHAAAGRIGELLGIKPFTIWRSPP